MVQNSPPIRRCGIPCHAVTRGDARLQMIIADRFPRRRGGRVLGRLTIDPISTGPGRRGASSRRAHPRVGSARCSEHERERRSARHLSAGWRTSNEARRIASREFSRSSRSPAKPCNSSFFEEEVERRQHPVESRHEPSPSGISKRFRPLEFAAGCA